MSKKNLTHSLALKFLRWFCPEHLYEEIEGDLIQKFNRDVKSFGEKSAKRRLVWSAIRFFRPGIILRNKFSIELTQLYMLRNYFKISVRTLLKHKGFSTINISGLAIGMAAFFLIVHYVQFERSYEDFNKNANHIYRVTLGIYKGTEYVMTDCGMYAPIGPMLKEKLPEVLDFARMWQHGIREVKAGTKLFYEEQIYSADPSALKMFSFNVLKGNSATALSAPFQVAITESMARKYFNRTDVINETIEIRKNPYKITAVVSDPAPNTHLKAKFLLSHASLAKLGYKEDEFQGNNEYTYLLMAEGVDLVSFNEKLKAISIDMKANIGDDRLVADRMKDIHLYSNKAYEPEVNGDARSVYFLLIIAGFVIIIAWINYINLSTARAIDRAREVGIRKIMGSLRIQLIWQFLSESFLVTTLAAVLTLIIMYTGLPLFKSLSGQNLTMNIFSDSSFWYLFLSILILGSVLSGLYPALVLSSFKPVAVLKGKFRATAHGQWLRKGLVVFQFAVTAVLIICVSMVYLQINFLQKQELGMSIEQMLVLRSPTLESDSLYFIKAESLKKELRTLSFVDNVTQSGVVPGLSLSEFSTTGNVHRPGQEKVDKGYIYFINAFDENFIPTYKMKLLTGRNFDTGKAAEDQLIINEEAVHALGFKDVKEAVGSKLFFYNREKTVIGVLQNFHQRSPKERHIPMVCWNSDYTDYFTLRVNSEKMKHTMSSIQSIWDKIYQDSPFDYFFLDQRYNQQYKSDQQFGNVIGVFAVLAILIACLGLFGLSSFTVLQRAKEIGIRKVLGSSVMQIVRLLSQDFITLVLMAGVVAMPLAYFAMKEWLANFAVRVAMNVWVFALPMVLIVLISVVTVSFQTMKAANTNPVNSLKSE